MCPVYVGGPAGIGPSGITQEEVDASVAAGIADVIAGPNSLATDPELAAAIADVIAGPNGLITATELNATVVGLQTALDDKLDDSQKGTASGLAELDGSGLVPLAQLPSDVIEAANLPALPGSGMTGKIYVTLDDNKTYRWSGSAYVEISRSLALGETSITAYRGDRGKTAYDHSQITAANPHGVTKADVGLGNANNTSDANKPVSTAQQTALDAKQPLGTGTPTVNTFLRGDGAWARPTPRAIYSSIVENLTRNSQQLSGAGAAVVLGTDYVQLDKGSSVTGGAGIELLGSGDTLNKWDRNPEFWAEYASGGSPAANTWDWYTTFGRAGQASALVPTSAHMGFLWRCVGGTPTLHATNANGTTQTLSADLLGSLNEFSLHSFMCRMTSGAKIEFYIDGVLMATHMTNLPSGSMGSLPMMSSGVKATSGTGGTDHHFHRYGFSYEAAA